MASRLPWWLSEFVCLPHGRPGFDPQVGKFPWRRKQQPTPGLLPGKFHGWRRLVGYSLWDCRVDTTEQLHFSLPIGPHSLTHLVKRADVLEGRLLLIHDSRPQIE